MCQKLSAPCGNPRLQTTPDELKRRLKNIRFRQTVTKTETAVGMLLLGMSASVVQNFR